MSVVENTEGGRYCTVISSAVTRRQRHVTIYETLVFTRFNAVLYCHGNGWATGVIVSAIIRLLLPADHPLPPTHPLLLVHTAHERSIGQSGSLSALDLLYMYNVHF